MTRAALLHGVDMAFVRAGERGHARAPSVALETRPEFRVLLATDPATARDDAERAIAQFARVGAVRVDVVHVVKPGGTIADAFASDRPLGPDDAQARVLACLARGVDASTTVVVGARRQEVVRMIRSEAIDLLCISSQEVLSGSRLSPAVNALPCPVVCCP